MAKNPIAQNRLFKNLFLCKKCGAKVRVEPKKVIEGKISCRKCKGKKFRAIKKT
jgi:formylmethanofuran dehydrogenase subunit E